MHVEKNCIFYQEKKYKKESEKVLKKVFSSLCELIMESKLAIHWVRQKQLLSLERNIHQI